MGYTTLANSIHDTNIKNILLDKFDNRLIIIDEIHNIRDEEKSNKIVPNKIVQLIEKSNNIKLLLLSATPMFDNYKEIIWLVNLMNLNDKRPLISFDDVFDNNGDFLINPDNGEEIGKKLFIRKITGYISFVEGGDLNSFPLRVYPIDFEPDKSIINKEYPTYDINNLIIPETEKRLIDYYTVTMDDNSIQKQVYDICIELKKKGKLKINLTDLQNLKLLDILNIVYPSSKTSNINEDNIKYIINNNTGKKGILQIFNNVSSLPLTFKNNNWNDMFKLDNLKNYSVKIDSICNKIKDCQNSVSLIYSEKFWSGVVPTALALEEMGYSRLNKKNNLLKNKKIDGLNYIMITGNKLLSKNNKDEIKAATSEDNKYGNKVSVIIISLAGAEGIDFKFIRNAFIIDPWYNMNRIEQIIGRCIREGSHLSLSPDERNCCIYMYSVYNENSYETIDMKLYRMAETKDKQISNVTRVLKETSIDCVLKKIQENKDEKSNIVKNITIDEIFPNKDEHKIKDFVESYYNNGNKLFPCQIIKVHDNGLYDLKFNYDIENITLPNNDIIQVNVDKKSYSRECDYLLDCEYKCKFINNNNIENINISDRKKNSDTYTLYNALINTNNVKSIIRDMFKEKFFYSKIDLFKKINFSGRTYTMEQIELAINDLIKQPNIILDRYNRKGTLDIIGDLYIFNPSEISNSDLKTFDRMNPVLDKNESFEITYSQEVEEENNNQNNDDYDNFIKNVDNTKDKLQKIIISVIKENTSLSSIYNINDSLIIKMCFEKLSPNEKLNVINFKSNNILSDILNDYIFDINGDKLIIGGKNKNEIVIFKQSSDKWEITQEYAYYKEKIIEISKDFKYIKSKPYYGLIAYDNNNNFIFKIKNVTKGDSKGKNCLSAKDDYKIILENLLQIKYDKLVKIIKSSKENLCKIIEYLFRFQNNIDNNTWLLSYDKFILIELKENNLKLKSNKKK